MRTTNILHHLDPKHGGVGTSTISLCYATSGADDSANILALCDQDETVPATPGIEVVRLPTGRLQWWTNPRFKAQVYRLVESSDVVHIHGLWREHVTYGISAATKFEKPVVVSAHGMLDRWALKSKRIKKAAYAAFIERRMLRRATVLKAATRQEAENYRDFGLKQPVVILPTGVSEPPATSSQILYAKYPDLLGRRLVVFLGRIDRKKGLDILIRAWSEVARRYPEAHLVIAGPDSGGYQSIIEESIKRLKISHATTVVGMIPSELKWSLLASAELFVLVSYSEGFSTSVLEALASRTPVLLSPQCNFDSVVSERCGWLASAAHENVTARLEEILSLSSAELQGFGERGRALISREYTWERVGQKMMDLYRFSAGETVDIETEDI